MPYPVYFPQCGGRRKGIERKRERVERERLDRERERERVRVGNSHNIEEIEDIT